jgi:hypothetical protein
LSFWVWFVVGSRHPGRWLTREPAELAMCHPVDIVQSIFTFTNLPERYRVHVLHLLHVLHVLHVLHLLDTL